MSEYDDGALAFRLRQELKSDVSDKKTSMKWAVSPDGVWVNRRYGK